MVDVKDGDGRRKVPVDVRSLTLCRSDRYWAGFSTDLVIEQVLMRSIKTTGGLTRGRGINTLFGCCLCLPVQMSVIQCNNSLGSAVILVSNTKMPHSVE